ncbi:MAG: hypothetical protein AB1397_06660 [bacterium]
MFDGTGTAKAEYHTMLFISVANLSLAKEITDNLLCKFIWQRNPLRRRIKEIGTAIGISGVYRF